MVVLEMILKIIPLHSIQIIGLESNCPDCGHFEVLQLLLEKVWAAGNELLFARC